MASTMMRFMRIKRLAVPQGDVRAKLLEMREIVDSLLGEYPEPAKRAKRAEKKGEDRMERGGHDRAEG